MLIVFINLIMIMGMFLFSRVTNISISVLFISFGISIMLCLLYPFLASWITFTQIIYLYTGLILVGTWVLYLAENKIFSHDYKNSTKKTFKETLSMETLDNTETLDDKEAKEIIAELEINGVPEIDRLSGTDEFTKVTETTVAPEVAAVLDVDKVTEVAKIPDCSPGVSYEKPIRIEVSEVNADVGSETVVLDVPAEVMEVEKGLSDVEEQRALENQDISSLVSGGFDCLATGNSVGAINNFFKALRLNPPPQLAVMLAIKISSLYLDVGCKRQALSLMDTLQDVWGPLLDEKDQKRVEIIKIQLRREI